MLLELGLIILKVYGTIGAAVLALLLIFRLQDRSIRKAKLAVIARKEKEAYESAKDDILIQEWQEISREL